MIGYLCASNNVNAMNDMLFGTKYYLVLFYKKKGLLIFCWCCIMFKTNTLRITMHNLCSLSEYTYIIMDYHQHQ